MKKYIIKFLSCIFLFTIFFGIECSVGSLIFPTVVYAETTEFLDGTGTEEDPYLISTKYQFDNIRNHLDSHFELVADIKFLERYFDNNGSFYNSGNYFISIGTSENPFSGVLKSNGFTIENIKSKGSIFGYCSNAKFYDLDVKNCSTERSVLCKECLKCYFENCSISGTGNCYLNSRKNSVYEGFGSYAETATQTKFIQCENRVNITTDCYAHGAGFTVKSVNCTFESCSNYGTIEGESSIAGLSAYDSNSSCVNCNNYADILTTDTYTEQTADRYSNGGLFGYKSGGKITNSKNFSNISGSYAAGGIVGYAAGVSVSYCSNIAVINAAMLYCYAGGIIGYNSASSISYCSNSGNIKSSTGSYSSYIYSQGAGGIAGYLINGSITNCYNTGNVLAYHYNCSCYAGGIVGLIGFNTNSSNKTQGTIANVYSTGNIGDITLGKDSAHAIVGYYNNSNGYSISLSNAYFLNESCSNNSASPYCEDGALTEEQLKSESNFIGFDFQIWFIDLFNEEYCYPQISGLDSSNIVEIKIRDDNQNIIQSVEKIVPDFTNVSIIKIDKDGNEISIPFSASYIYSGFDVNQVGEQNIKAKYGGFISSNSLPVQINAKQISSIEISSNPTKLKYYQAREDLDISGGKVQINYNSGTNEIIDMSQCTVHGYDNSEIGTKTIFVNYSGYSCSFEVMIYNLTSINIKTIPTKTTYVLNLDKNFTTGKLKLNYSNGDIEYIAITNEMCSWEEKIGTQSVNVSYDGCTTSFDITITKEINYYELTGPTKLQYNIDDNIDLAGSNLKIVYVSDDNYTINVPLTNEMISGFDTSTSGVKTITVNYETIIDSFVISVKNLYTITFINYDDSTITSTTYHYGDTVEVPSTPTKPSDNTYSYTFAGWDNEVTTVTGKATYKATYTPVYIDYTVAFVDYDGTTISSNTYHYGDAVTAPNNPTRQVDSTYTYVFKAWDKEVVNCAGDATYTATYTPTYIDYTVVFKNYDGTVLSTATYHYGDTVEEPSAPTKSSDETYDYEFSGWDKTVTTCDGDKIYTAQFTQIENAQHKSTELLNELTGIIDSINKVDLDTYQTIISIQEQANELLDADKIKLNAKLQPIINQYVNYVKSINNEYAVAESVESNYFLVVLEMINYISVLAYAVLKGRRWFL